MDYLYQFLPAYLKRLDRSLLLNKPEVWVLRPHVMGFYLSLLTLLSIGISLIILIDGSRSHSVGIFMVTTLGFGLLSLVLFGIWAYSQFTQTKDIGVRVMEEKVLTERLYWFMGLVTLFVLPFGLQVMSIHLINLAENSSIYNVFFRNPHLFSSYPLYVVIFYHVLIALHGAGARYGLKASAIMLTLFIMFTYIQALVDLQGTLLFLGIPTAVIIAITLTFKTNFTVNSDALTGNWLYTHNIGPFFLIILHLAGGLFAFIFTSFIALFATSLLGWHPSQFWQLTLALPSIYFNIWMFHPFMYKTYRRIGVIPKSS